MKKLSLDDLKVESYASQVSETELAEVKGGTFSQCYYINVWGPLAIDQGISWVSNYFSGGASGGHSGSYSIQDTGSGSIIINGDTITWSDLDSLNLNGEYQDNN